MFMSLRNLLLGLLVAGFVSGCQCSQHTNHYLNCIDDVSDHKPCLDDHYNADHDLTRIGHPDSKWTCHCRKCCR